MLRQVSVALPEGVEKTLTPQLLHPQLVQSPLQVAQLAQEQGAILVGKGSVMWVWVDGVCYCVCVCVGGWMVILWEVVRGRKKERKKERKESDFGGPDMSYRSGVWAVILEYARSPPSTSRASI